VRNLKLLGIDARIRMVDAAQYQQRLKDFDFDITTQRYVMRNTPGVELRSYFSSEAAKMDGSLNLAGIADPAVDTLIERILAAKTREELETAARALDRVLRAGHYWVPHWYKASNVAIGTSSRSRRRSRASTVVSSTRGGMTRPKLPNWRRRALRRSIRPVRPAGARGSSSPP
jgi:ABC-type oligopeptide transport system substrate-binding subunit